jgi:endoglucanase
MRLPYCPAVVWQSWLAARRRRRAGSSSLDWLIVCSVLAASMLALARVARAADSDVRVNSIGYVTGHAKRVSVAAAADSFVVRRAADDSAALTADLAAPIADASGDMVAIGDFSALDDPGSYYVDVPGVGHSAVFPIGDDVYQTPLATAMLGFYGARCGTAVSFTYQGTTFAHGACHLNDGHLDYVGQTAVMRDGTRGWHDAGDYGKYTVNGAFAAGMLLSAWERHRDGLGTLVLPIPESGGPIPDFLAEVKWELDWLLKMQYAAGDARVSHKLTETMFEDFILPEKDVAPRYFVPYGTAATADLVAVLAQASRLYAPYDADFAAQCLAAARASYDYLVANTANVAANQVGFSTGGYGTTDPDDRLWAAAEMWETTGDPAALADVEARIAALPGAIVDADFDWNNTKNLGLSTYLISAREGRNPSIVAAVRASVMTAAMTIAGVHDGGGYGRGVMRYYWGSNGSVARASIVLDLASRLSGDSTYLDVAVDQLAYLFGRNHYNRSQVTGLGLQPPLSPHHRPSVADTNVNPFPGLLVGGGTTASNWQDDWTMYTLNEVAINWNAPLVYALSLFVPGGAAPRVIIDAGAVDASDGGDAADAADAGVTDHIGTPSSHGCGCAVGAADASAAGGGASAPLGTVVVAAIACAAMARRRRRG